MANWRAVFLWVCGGLAYGLYIVAKSSRDWANHFPEANAAYVLGVFTPILAVAFCIGWFGFRKPKPPTDSTDG